MGSRRRVKYMADAIDSIRSDWWMSDDGIDRGPIDSWPGPFLGTDDGSNRVPRRELRRSGTREGARFDGHVGPVPKVLPARSFFDDGGLNTEGRKLPVGMSSPVIRDARKEDALFSRTAVGGDAYRFLRQMDPGADNTFAPRRGPHFSTSTSATMAGAGFIPPFSDTAGVGTDHLNPGEAMALGSHLQSKNGRFRLDFQKSDGNLVLYSGSAPLWNSGTRGRGAIKVLMQKDGNLVIYDRKNRPLWASGTQGRPGAFLSLNDDANLVVYQGGRPLWNSGTWGGVVAGSHESKSFLSKVGGAFESVGEGAFSAVKSVGEGAIAVGGGLAKTVANVATSPVKLASDLASGRNVLESLGDTVKRDLQSAKELAPYAQAVLSVVPGVGQGVNAAIAAGAAIAHGQPITQALVAGVKGMVPGGPIAQQALSTAYNLAKGQNVTDAALSLAREQLPPAAQQAFDTGLALAHGQSLQQIAKDKGMSFATDFAKAQLSPLASRALSSTGPAIGSVAQSALSVVPPNVKQAANALLNNPSLRSLPVADVARRLNLPVDHVQQAMASIAQAAQRTGMGQVVRSIAPAHDIANRIGNASFDRVLSRYGSRVAPIAMGHNRAAPRILPRYPHLMPGAMGLQDAGAFFTIKLGSTGEDVKAWQNIIHVTPDGKFGPQTDAATRSWQRAHGLVADGVVGPKTWAAAGPTGGATTLSSGSSTPGTFTLPEVVISAAPPPPMTPAQTSAANSMPTIKLGSSGPAVATWQGILRRDSGISGFTTAPDGQFGPITDRATRAWQRSSGLTPDGVVGPQTWTKGIGSLTTAPLPAEKAPGVALPTPVPPGLPPGLPPVPTQPSSAPPPVIATIPPVTIGSSPPIFTPPMLPPTPVSAPPPSPGQTDKAGGAVAALAVGALAAKLAGIF